MKYVQVCKDALPVAQQKIWDSFSAVKKLGFTLYGGTALALYLGHRMSVDFNFFSDRPLDSSMEQKLHEVMPFLASAEVLQREQNTRTYFTRDKVKISFFGGIPFGRVGDPVLTDDGVMQLASLHDLFATKLAVISQRIEYKDYFDIVSLLRYGISLKEGMAGAIALYRENFLPQDTLKILCYFEGGDLNCLTSEDKEFLVSICRNFSLCEITPMPISSFALSAFEPDDNPVAEPEMGSSI